MLSYFDTLQVVEVGEFMKIPDQKVLLTISGASIPVNLFGGVGLTQADVKTGTLYLDVEVDTIGQV